MSLPRELCIYVRFTGDSDVGTDNPIRDAAILAEILAVRDAPTLLAAMAEIEWWGFDDPGELQRVTRELRKRLRRKDKTR